eukprot:SAG31_NODE_1354_length_8661_cov_170.990306_5_plen_74_part_00
MQLYFSQSEAQAVRPKLILLAFAKVDRSTADLVSSLTLRCHPLVTTLSFSSVQFCSVICEQFLRLTSSDKSWH